MSSLNVFPRKIIHCDCDCFYAAVEMRDDPSLRDKPLAVGGRAEQRGVVATCNYEARKYGVRSAMSTAQALRRCPDLIVLPPAMEKYRIASRQILAIYRDYTELVEPLSLDEAYLDVTHASLHGSATAIAQQIRTPEHVLRIRSVLPHRPALRRTSSLPRSPATGTSRTASSSSSRRRWMLSSPCCRFPNCSVSER